MAGATFAAVISLTGCAAIDLHSTRTAKTSICATGTERALIGRCYSKEDIERTGATTVAGALRQIDPAIKIR